MKIAILSDTHGLLRPAVLEQLKTADVILHGGDINRQSVVDALRQYAPLYVVRGNNDKAWAEDIPHDLTVTLEGVTFYMVHNKKELPTDLTGVDVVVFGHSHKYVQEEKDGILWLLPLQRFLKIKPSYGTEPDRRFCWDLHVIDLRGRKCLLAVHC